MRWPSQQVVVEVLEAIIEAEVENEEGITIKGRKKGKKTYHWSLSRRSRLVVPLREIQGSPVLCVANV